jgi:hypothetical protein
MRERKGMKDRERELQRLVGVKRKGIRKRAKKNTTNGKYLQRERSKLNRTIYEYRLSNKPKQCYQAAIRSAATLPKQIRTELQKRSIKVD